MIPHKLSIQSQSKTYEVQFIAQIAELLTEICSLENAVIVADQCIGEYYADFIARLKTKFPVLFIAATEDNKTVAGMETVVQFLQQNNATRSTTIVAIGGGIVQDISSLAAHLYYRGLPFYFIPTTLLAMCDSCIGAKCGLNYGGFKNQLGAFHSPEKIFIWNGFINSLPEAALYSGYGEIVKLMLTASHADYTALKQTLQNQPLNNPSLPEFIYKSLEIKKGFIEADEFDKGIRNQLNYGHTFGHSLELVTDYAIAHGIAVARGIDLANYIAFKKGYLSEAHYNDIHTFIEKHFYCQHRPVINATDLIANTMRDKKVSGGKLNMILLTEPGQLEIVPITFDDEFKNIVSDYLQGNPALYANCDAQESEKSLI